VPVFKLTIEYDGAGFSGWQAQPGRRTAQGVLEDALAVVLRRPVRVQGASRTDAGVHAAGQVASFGFDGEIEPARLVAGLCALCRPDLAVLAVEGAPDGFNARFDTTGKRYRYRVLNRPAPSPLWGRISWHVSGVLDRGAMADAIGRMIGTRDFAGFRAADCERENTVRTLARVSIEDGPFEGLIEIVVEGDGFLKNMVRILAGTLVDVGLGKLPASVVDEVFASGDRTRAGRTAPARGLTLERVFY
jgi:tRNA pseudouridine38-40 synthase